MRLLSEAKEFTNSWQNLILFLMTKFIIIKLLIEKSLIHFLNGKINAMGG